MECVLEFPNSIPNILCDTIIENYKDNNSETENCFVIPKNHNDWDRIERLLYKELLININKYKIHIVQNISFENNADLTMLLNNDLYLKDFIIIKRNAAAANNYKTNNRYNILTFVFFLNNITIGGNINFYNKLIKPEKGKLVLFPECFNENYNFKLPNDEDQYIVTGQLCYENVIN